MPKAVRFRKTIQLEQIIKKLREHLPYLQKHYSVKTLGVFGSYARGEQKPASDIDILVEFNQAPSLFKYIELENHISELLGIKVDLVMKSSLKPRIGQRILSEVHII